MSANNIDPVGVWELKSFTIHPLFGDPRPWGEALSGLLIYTASGHMSVAINKAVSPHFGHTDQDVLDSLLFYAGTFTVQGKTIRHRVIQSSNPDRVQRELIRHATLDNGQLKLLTPDETFGKAELLWTKLA